MYNELETLRNDCFKAAEAKLKEAGEYAVEYNKENGNYKNVTGNLRRSNYYRLDKVGDVPVSLAIGNSAEYARNVESKGYMVVTGGALAAHRMLNDD